MNNLFLHYNGSTRLKKIVSLILLIGLIFAIPTFSLAKEKNTSKKDDKVIIPPDQALAIVNGKKVLLRDWALEYKNLSEALETKLNKDEYLIILRDEIIKKEAISSLAVKEGIDKSLEYEALIKKAKRDILSELYIKKALNTQVSEKELKNGYEELKKKYKNNTEYNASHILLNTRHEAEKAITRLSNGENFESLAKEISTSEEAKNGGNLGYFKIVDMPVEFGTELKKLKDGDISKKPVKTSFGYHIIKKISTKSAKIESYNKLKGLIGQEIKRTRAIQLSYNAVKNSDVKLFNKFGKEVK